MTIRTITVTLGDGNGAAANLDDLSVSFYDENMPHLTTAARYQSAVETTNADGVLTFSCDSTLEIGETGLLTVLGPNNVHFNGPVEVY